LLLDRGEVGGTFRKVMMSRLRRRKLLAGSSSTIPRKFKSMSVAMRVELAVNQKAKGKEENYLGRTSIWP